MAPKPLLDEAQPFKLVKPDRYRTELLKIIFYFAVIVIVKWNAVWCPWCSGSARLAVN